MAEIIWTEPALIDLDEIAEYIALDNLIAAKNLVKEVFTVVDRLSEFPNSGRQPPELPHSKYLEVLSNPCRIIYRIDNKCVYILHVMRTEMKLRRYLIDQRSLENLEQDVND